jgi:hypothetical protein
MTGHTHYVQDKREQSGNAALKLYGVTPDLGFIERVSFELFEMDKLKSSQA